ncbi:Transcriptional regulator of ribosomal biogenesis proteins [Rhizophlyctis rosea]|nr:Transcriptional regulator of ribosomal biogenesis proteins [Rhizophlyctis rosea]
MPGPTQTLQHPQQFTTQNPTPSRNDFACCDQKFGSFKEVMHHMSTKHVLGRENRRNLQNSAGAAPQGPIHLHKRLPPDEQTGASQNITVTVNGTVAPAASGGEFRSMHHHLPPHPSSPHVIHPQPQPTHYLQHHHQQPYRQPVSTLSQDDESSSSFDGSSRSLSSSSVSPVIPLHQPTSTQLYTPAPQQGFSFLNDEYDVDAFLGLSNSGDASADTLSGMGLEDGDTDFYGLHTDTYLKDETPDTFNTDHSVFPFTFNNPLYPPAFDPLLRRRSMSAPPAANGMSLHDFQMAVAQPGVQEMDLEEEADVGGLVGGGGGHLSHGQEGGVNMAAVMGLDGGGLSGTGFDVDLGLGDLGDELSEALGLDRAERVGDGKIVGGGEVGGGQSVSGGGGGLGLTPSPVLSTATGGSVQSPYSAPSPAAFPQSPHTLPRAASSQFGQANVGKGGEMESMDLAFHHPQGAQPPRPLSITHNAPTTAAPPTLPRTNSKKRKPSDASFPPPPLRHPSPAPTQTPQLAPQQQQHPYISIPHHPHPRINHLISSHAPSPQPQPAAQPPLLHLQQNPYQPFYTPQPTTDINRSPSPAPSVASDGGLALGMADWTGISSPQPPTFGLPPHSPHLHLSVPPRPASSLGFTREGGRWNGSAVESVLAKAQERDTKTGERIYRCPKAWCSKVYKNANGLKYHLDKGICEVDVDSSSSPSSQPLLHSPLPPHGQPPSPLADPYNIASTFSPFGAHSPGGGGMTPQTGYFDMVPPPGTHVKIAHRPYWCRVSGCGKKYKNLNGLKYHARAAHPGMDFKEEVKGVGV